MHKKAPVGPLADYLSIPFVCPDESVGQVEFLALDFEATGLDIDRDEILSVGYTVVRNMKVLLAESAHFLVRPIQDIPEQTAVLHGILDDRSAQGVDLAEAVERILAVLKGRVLLAHHGAIETGFLNKACKQLYGCGVVFPLVDTFAIEYRSLQRRGVTPSNTGLRLANLRNKYGLPRYPVHNALSDALATAELFLAQVAQRRGQEVMLLKDVLVRK